MTTTIDTIAAFKRLSEASRMTSTALARLTCCFDTCHGRDLTHGRWLAWCRLCGYNRPLIHDERRNHLGPRNS